MNFGIDVPNHNAYSDPRLLVQLACEAEAAGWDGFFVWDHLVRWNDRRIPLADPWIALAAIAVKTERICLGPMVTPLTRRRPWKLARETVTLDHLSAGRLVLGIGLGARSDAEFKAFGDEGDPKVRAAMLDEGLAVLAGLWSGETFSYRGEYYQIEETQFRPGPVQFPRIPIWVAGTWPNKRPFRRAARWDGVFPLGVGQGQLDMVTPNVMTEIATYVMEHRTDDAPFDIVHSGITPGDSATEDAQIVAPYAALGVTWWLENINPERGSFQKMRRRVRSGPPKI
jgi:alkanesulfonate monooxygenase SsuD/methylene tetrahydromethanopterin reductase-like flavin-dependent oxidoreductase (luciferase family)